MGNGTRAATMRGLRYLFPLSRMPSGVSAGILRSPGFHSAYDRRVQHAHLQPCLLITACIHAQEPAGTARPTIAALQGGRGPPALAAVFKRDLIRKQTSNRVLKG